jgi:hypothetical protein
MIEIGKPYKDGRGNTHTIMGPTRYNKAFVWSLQGSHFRQEDGRYIRDGQPQDQATVWDLAGEA